MPTFIDFPQPGRDPLQMPDGYPIPQTNTLVGILSQGKQPEDEIEFWRVRSIHHFPFSDPPETRVLVRR